MTLLEEVAATDHLTKAWWKIYSGKTDDVREHSKGIDDVSIADFKNDWSRKISDISAQLHDGRYHMLPLLGFVQAKKSGKLRLITAPTVTDRIVHASILSAIQIHYPEIRNGSSYCLPRSTKKSQRISYLDAFKTLIEQVKLGRSFVFESDIQSFFDKVEKQSLLKKITSSLPDTSLDELIREIVYFKVGNLNQFKKSYEEGKLELPQSKLGLSQGSPLSPLFANIYLSAFDQSVIKKFSTQYIRYVDDFIVMCSTAEEAQKAHALISELLDKEGLTLPKESKETISKTRVGLDLNNGDSFTFLGISISRDGLIPNESLIDLKNFVDGKCFALKKVRMTLSNKKIPISKNEVQKQVNLSIQSKFGSYGYFHTDEYLKTLNQLIANKAKQAMLENIRLIKSSRKGMPLISQQSWQKLFVVTSST